MKMIKDYEVEGCWSLGKSKCRGCGKALVEVPREGHYNSQFWENEREDGLLLSCCPDGCSEKEATEKMREYMANVPYVKGKSYNWEWDYKKLFNGWISPGGRIFPCEYKQHLRALPKKFRTGRGAEIAGYMKFGENPYSKGKPTIDFSWGKKLSLRQKKFLEDYAVDHNYIYDASQRIRMDDENMGLCVIVKK